MASTNQKLTVPMSSITADHTLTVVLTATGTKQFQFLIKLASIFLGLARGCLLRSGFKNVDVNVEVRGSQHRIHEEVV
jgi:hypothetical protein